MLSSSAFAISIPRGDRTAPDKGGFHIFEEHLTGYSNVVVDAKGRATAWALFTSEIKFGGERHVAVSIQIWAGKELLYATNFSARLADALFHGGHVRVPQERKFVLKPAQWATVTKITYTFTQAIPKELCDLYWQKYTEGNNLLDPQLTGCPRR